MFAIMIDLDKFKSINDTLGHLVGDNALVQTAKLLRICTSRDDFIARMGGDEFVIIGERANPGQINHLINEIESRTFDFNKTRQQKYMLSLSIGYSVFRNGDTIDSFLAAADKKMYQNKLEHMQAMSRD